MSKSYTNRNDEVVHVTSEHIDMAIKIYEELSKLSPSKRVNWSKHRKMMELEGLFDSENSESYRQLIKRSRSEKGLLPSVAKYADMVVDEKISAIKHELGEIKYAKQDAQDLFNKVNRVQREISRDLILVELIGEKIDQFDWTRFTERDFTPIANEDKPTKKAIACISDLHYGYVGSNHVHTYNTEVARELLFDYADKLIQLAKDENITEYLIANIGDLVEGFLRNQSYVDTQKNLSEQAVEATDLILDFLAALSPYVSVKYTGIGGNHDRITKNYKEAIEGDNVMFTSNAIVERVSRYLDGIDFVKPDNIYHTIVEINGLNTLLVHGDRTPMYKDSTLAEQSSVFGVELDIIAAGHFHSHYVKEVGLNKTMAVFGSIKGADEYSIKIGKTSSRSQGVILIDESGDYEIKQIKL